MTVMKDWKPYKRPEDAGKFFRISVITTVIIVAGMIIFILTYKG